MATGANGMPCPICEAVSRDLDTVESFALGYALGQALGGSPHERMCELHRRALVRAQMQIVASFSKDT